MLSKEKISIIGLSLLLIQFVLIKKIEAKEFVPITLSGIKIIIPVERSQGINKDSRRNNNNDSQNKSDTGINDFARGSKIYETADASSLNKNWTHASDPVLPGTPTRYCKPMPPLNVSLQYVYDNEKKSKVLSVGIAYGCMSAALFKIAINNRSDTQLLWDIKYNNEFFFKVTLSTKKGNRTLYYTPTNKKPNYLTYDIVGFGSKKKSSYNKRPFYGFVLGSQFKDGHWHRISRDLAKDLKSKEPDNELISINDFYVSGNGRLDNISVVYSPKSLAKEFVKAYLSNRTGTMQQITSKQMITKLLTVDSKVKSYFRTINSYHEMIYFHDLKAMVIAISKGEEIKFYFSWTGRRWVLDRVL